MFWFLTHAFSACLTTTRCRFVIVLALGSFFGYKIAAKRKQGLLNEEEQNQDYGTVPQVHVQVC